MTPDLCLSVTKLDNWVTRGHRSGDHKRSKYQVEKKSIGTLY